MAELGHTTFVPAERLYGVSEDKELDKEYLLQ